MFSTVAGILLCVGALTSVALLWLFRAIAFKVREDYRLERTQRIKTYDGLAQKFAWIAAISLLYAGFWRHEWVPAIGFMAFCSALSATYWLNKPRS